MTTPDIPHGVAAQRLAAARATNTLVHSADIQLPDAAAAYAVQGATLALLSPQGAAADSIGGWKVGAADIQAAQHCAPLPRAGLFASGATLSGPQWRWRFVELEAALRLGRDLDPQGRLLSREELAPAFDAVLPTLEVVESRLADGRAAHPMARLADLQSHGALVVGAPSALAPRDLDLRALDATLTFDGAEAVQTHGGNPAQDVWRLLAWLALHCAERGMPLRRGQIVTTGSCTGLVAAPLVAQVQGHIAGLGSVSLRFTD